MSWILSCSIAYHQQTNGQNEQTIQKLKDMLRACIIDFGGSWDSYLPLAEFSYNKNYHSKIGAPHYELLYGISDPSLFGRVWPESHGGTKVVLKTIKIIQQVRQRLRKAQSRQKCYVDRHCSKIQFQYGDMVLLKVLPQNWSFRLGIWYKLGPIFI